MLIRRTRWHAEADVVVIGYGLGGAAAALTAREGGADVIILEKQDSPIPVSTSMMAGAVFINPSDAREARRYLEATCRTEEGRYWTPPDILRVLADYSVENQQWLRSFGVDSLLRIHGGEHQAPGVESIDVYQVRGRGVLMMEQLDKQVRARGITVMNSTAATDLLTNERGEVVGVAARQGGRRVNVQARRAVVLATGGFEFDEEMKLQYLKVYPSYFGGTTACTGDGVRMALGVGADLWHMNCCSATYALKFPDFPQGFLFGFTGKHWRSPGESVLEGFAGRGWGEDAAERLAAIPGYVVVDRDGKRYTNENVKPHTVYYELGLYDTQRLMHPRIPSYWIFDQKRLDDSPLIWETSGIAGPLRGYKWSRDNRAELEKGWIKRGETIADLARQMDIPPETLQKTVDNYNLYCQHGEDAEFHRAPETLVPLANPPYYSVPIWPGGPNTHGGPRRDRKAQILRADGKPVPRLYGNGELGSVFGMLYPAAGGSFAECIVFGRIAGENACALPPR
ncbi:MAG: FAD-dependent oxidoreductase [Chloroflexota bacterium]